MNLLVVLGTGAAYFYSLAVLFLPGLFPPEMRNVYFDGAAAIITFVLLGRYLEERSKTRANRFMKELAALMPAKATILVEGKETEVFAENIVTGDRFLVRTGEKIPADGVLKEGAGEVDASAVTGESLPVAVRPGDRITGGTVLLSGHLSAEADKPAAAGVVRQMMKTLRKAQGEKPPIGRLADRIAAIFVPAVVGISLLTFTVWVLAGGGFQYAFLTGVTVLIISCPCALGLAVPIALVSALGRGAKEGILLKNPAMLETSRKVDAALFDKTGTLTTGELAVREVRFFGDKPRAAATAGALAATQTHPVSRAVAAWFRDRGEDSPALETSETLPGKGVRGMLGGEAVLAGSPAFLEEEGVALPEEARTFLRQARSTGASVTGVARANELLALFAVKDAPRKEAAEVVAALKREGIEPMLLSGDHEEAVRAVAEELGIGRWYAGVLPAEKHKVVEGLQKEGKTVLFAGDGINDTLALKQADIGVAMHSGTDLAQEAGDVILVRNDLRGVPAAVRLSRAALANVKQNLAWAYLYNAVGIPVAAGLLYPVWGILLEPAMAGMAMALSSVSVVLNALRLQWVRL